MLVVWLDYFNIRTHMKSLRVFVLLITTFCSSFAYSQMITLYEFGAGTPDSIPGNFSFNVSSATSCFSFNPSGMGFEFHCSVDSADAIAYLYTRLQPLANYQYIEFYIEYANSSPANEISLIMSNNNAFSSVANHPVMGTVVANNIASGVTIPYTNSYPDSIVKIQMEFPDSGNIIIQYIRIDVDTSTFTTQVTELNDPVFQISQMQNQLNVVSDQDEPFQVEVFSLNGTLILESTFEGSGTIQLPNKSAMNIVLIKTAKTVLSRKIFTQQY